MHNNYKYAKALFNVSNETSNISLITKELQLISYLYKKTSTFRLLLITKKIDVKKKSEIIRQIFNMLNPLTIEFLNIVITNNHSNQLLNIINKFNHIKDSQLGSNRVDIITAFPLSEEELNSLSHTISGILNSTPSVNNITQPEIVGGMKLRVGNNVFDNSISYQINQLKKTLYNV